MARYIGPVCRLCRREDMKLFLKGDRCYTDKCGFERRAYAPGQHGQARKRKMSNYGEQLREKQKVKRIYGIAERQFRGYYYKASRIKGVTGENLLVLLERRLDNVVFALGFAHSRRAGRQLIAHGNVYVNGRRCDIASALVRSGDRITLTTREGVRKVAKDSLEQRSSYPMPAWLERDGTALEGRVTAVPARTDITFDVREQLIVELMSK